MARSATKGLGLVEVILACAVFAVIAAGLLGAFAYSEQAGIIGGERARALGYAEEGIEAARSLRDGSFASLTAGTFGVTSTGSAWQLAGTSTTQDGFTRSLSIVASSTNRFQVRSTVTWIQNGRRTGAVALTSWLTNWLQRADWSAPSVAGGLDLASSTIAVEVAVSGNYAYVVRNTGTGVPNFVVVNISNPAAPTLVSSLTLPGPLSDVAVSGTYAMVSSGDDTREFQVVNISNPAAPAFVAAVDLLGTADATGVAFSGGLGVVTRKLSASNEVALINIANLLLPVSISGIDIDGDATDVVISGSNAYVSSASDNNEVVVVNCAITLTPFVSGTLNVAGTTDATTIAVSGSNLLVGFADGALRTYTTGLGALSATTIGTGYVQDVEWGTGSTSTAFAVASAATSSQFFALDLTNVSAPALLGGASVGADLYGVAYSSTISRAVAVGALSAREVTIFAP